ncbi:MAG TPA: hypothetical protein VD837_00305 [Terriglobales bacterium]|nr:hypothetical protein [Terriglobales bacterium]
MRIRSMRLILTLVVGSVLTARGQEPDLPDIKPGQDYVEWLTGTMSTLERVVKPGMTREEFRKLFRSPGGFQTHTCLYRTCPLIRMRVEFSVSETRETRLESENGEVVIVRAESPNDVVIRASKPYLDLKFATD